jgi:peptide/nickel transport system permease protein
MRAYAVRRLLLVIPTLFLVTVLVFLSVRFLPGDIVDIMQMQMERSWSKLGQKIDRAALERRLGLDVPVYVQYGRWVGGIVLRGTLGPSLMGGDTVEQSIAQRLPVTLQLGLMSVLIGLVIAVPVGIYSAIRQDTAGDYVGRSLAILGLATPNFWLATMVIVFPAIWWRWSPPLVLVSFSEDPLGSLAGFAIPSLILGTYLSAATMRMTRTMMLEVLRQDYIRTAWSKGLRERTVILRHAVKNTLIPVVSLVALQVPILVGGSVIIENIFNLPGLGRLLVDALSIRDYPIVSGVNLVFATVVVAVNLVTDLSYALIDPRVRYPVGH